MSVSPPVVTDRLGALRVVDPVLTQLARGYSNAEFVGETLFPVIGNLLKESGVLPQFGKEAFKLYNTTRAIRAGSNRINPEGITPIKFVLDEHDLEYPIDYREEEEAIFPLQAHATKVTTDGIGLGREMQQATLAQDPNQYVSTSKLALSTTDCFDQFDTSKPIEVIQSAREAIRQKIGKYPNTMVIGASAYEKGIKFHPELLNLIKFTQLGTITEDLMKSIFEVSNIKVGKSIWSDDANGFHDVWGDNIVLAYVPPSSPGMERNMYEPSYGYTLRKKDNPIVDKRPENGGKIQVIRSTDIYDVFLVGAEAGFLIQNIIK